MWIRQGQISNQLVSSIGAESFKSLTKEIENREMDIIMDVANQIIDQDEKFAQTAKDLVEEKRNRMERLLKENEGDTKTAMAENGAFRHDGRPLHQG